MTSQEQTPGPPRWSRLVGASLLAVMFLVNVYRAATLAVVHDEALTYQWYLAGPWRSLWDMSANNHFLCTLLARLSMTVFGLSELSLRLPSLAGGALAFLALWQLASRATRSATSFLLILGLVALNPLFLDFCCAARGYGLATAFLLWGMVFILRATDDPTDHRQWLRCSFALGLSLAANLALLWADLAVAIFLAAIILHERAKVGALRDAMLNLLLWLILPGPLLATALWAPLLIEAKPEHFYAGTPSLRYSAGGFIAATLFPEASSTSSVSDLGRTPFEMRASGDLPAKVVGWLAGGGLIFLSVLLALAAARLGTRAGRHGIAVLEPPDRLLLLTSTGILVTLGIYVLLHVLRGGLYPPDRAIVYLVPLLAIAWLLLPRAAASGGLRQGLGYLTGLVAAGVLAASITGFHPAYFHSWRYDAGARHLVSAIWSASSGGEARVASHWIYTPALEFYRDLHSRNDQIDWLRLEQPEAHANFLIAHPTDHAALDQTTWRLIDHDPISGTDLYQRTSPLAPQPPSQETEGSLQDQSGA